MAQAAGSSTLEKLPAELLHLVYKYVFDDLTITIVDKADPEDTGHRASYNARLATDLTKSSKFLRNHSLPYLHSATKIHLDVFKPLLTLHGLVPQNILAKVQSITANFAEWIVLQSITAELPQLKAVDIHHGWTSSRLFDELHASVMQLRDNVVALTNEFDNGYISDVEAEMAIFLFGKQDFRSTHGEEPRAFKTTVTVKILCGMAGPPIPRTNVTIVSSAPLTFLSHELY